jgi:hypothetical protein
MFEALLGKIVGSTPMSERAEGAAFLKVARDLYQLKSLAYLGVNIPVASGQPRQRLSAQSRAAHQLAEMDSGGKDGMGGERHSRHQPADVRFHPNAAREKLDCATTTQAVAKAITQHLIDV